MSSSSYTNITYCFWTFATSFLGCFGSHVTVTKRVMAQTKYGLYLLVLRDGDSSPGSVLVLREAVSSCTPIASFILERNANL